MGRRVATSEFESRVRAVRMVTGMSQEQLAQRAGLTRQAISSIEIGHYVPNTAVALRLAHALGCRVEDLFVLPERITRQAVQVVGSPAPDVRRLAVAKVRGRWVGYPLGAGRDLQEGFLSADGLLSEGGPRGQAQLLAPPEQLERAAVLLGCDPSLGILTAHLARRSTEARLLWLSASSQAALNAIAAGEAHVAGSHLQASGTADHDVPRVRQALGKTGGLLVAFARWEQGLVVAPGNPKALRSVADLARPDVRMINRETGAGSRALLDGLLAAAHVPPQVVSGYDRILLSHLAVAQAVATGGADAGVALRAAARALGLDFVPLAAVPFDFVIPRDHLRHPAVAIMLDLMQSQTLRAELRALPGYDVDALGTVVADFPASA